MEVHHHPTIEKKNFKEYFLEFLMIFLAVTMGFFAENIRENISNNNQENEYARSMVTDLQNDISMYENFDSINFDYCNMIDTILISINNKTLNTGKIYYLARRLTMLGSTVPSLNAKTYLQMTSTGAFRVIKHQRIADSIALYYQLMKSFDSWSDLQRARINNLIAVNDKIFNADVFFSMYKAIDSKSDSVQYLIKRNPAFLTNNVHEMNAVKMQYQYYYGFMKLMIGRNLLALEQAKKLIALLKKEYHITS
jgi:hypothetical protein